MDSLSYTVWFDIVIHLLVYYLDRLRAWCTYHFFYLIVIACMCAWVIYHVLCLTPCCVTALLRHDCMTLVHVGRTSILFTSNSPSLGHSFNSDSHYCKCEALCVLVTLTEPEIRGRVWRRAISMFGSVLEVIDTLMSIGVRSLKTCISQS